MTDNKPDLSQTPFQSKAFEGYDFARIERIPFYFGPEYKRLFGFYHNVPGIKQSDTAILICPSLGVEYMNAYRPLRYVADYHALEGIPAMRFDYIGTGDSSGVSNEMDRIEDWVWSIKQAIEKLKELSNCQRVILFGFRMGATLAALISESHAVDDLILWAPLENGKRYIREIRALQLTAEYHVESDLLEAGGAVFYPDAICDLENIKLPDLSPKVQRILIIPRDDLPANEKLKEAWLSKGIETAQIRCDGYAGMMVDAHNVEIPHHAIQKITAWSRNAIIPGVMVSGEYKLPSHSIIKHFNPCLNEKGMDAVEIEEQILRYGPEQKRLAVLSRPVSVLDNSKPVVILANSGANHRVGPNRLYVLIARELSRKGFQCLRIDIDGLGDSALDNPEKENVVYIEHSSDEISLAMAAHKRNSGSSKYVIMGLCSGAYFSFHAALDLNEVNLMECILINPLTFYWDEGMSLDVSPTQNFQDWNWYKFAIKNPASWVKLLMGRVHFKALTKTLFDRIGVVVASKFKQSAARTTDASGAGSLGDLSSDLLAIANNKTDISIYLARKDPGYDILMTSAGKVAKQLIKKKMMRIKFFEDADHTFSRYSARCDLVSSLVSDLTEKY